MVARECRVQMQRVAAELRENGVLGAEPQTEEQCGEQCEERGDASCIRLFVHMTRCGPGPIPVRAWN